MEPTAAAAMRRYLARHADVVPDAAPCAAAETPATAASPSAPSSLPPGDADVVHALADDADAHVHAADAAFDYAPLLE